MVIVMSFRKGNTGRNVSTVCVAMDTTVCVCVCVSFVNRRVVNVVQCNAS